MSLSKRKKKTGATKRKAGNLTKLPVRQAAPSKQELDKKLSEIIKEMALRLLKKPDAGSSEPASMAILMLAGAAWNRAIGDDGMREEHRQLIDQIDWEDVKPWAELRTADTEQLIAELVEYKREHYPNDLRRVVATEVSSEGKVQVHWTPPKNVVNAPLGTARPRATVGKAKCRRPIADKLVKKMNRDTRGKVIDLKADQDQVVLRELVTNRVCRALCPSGYRGEKGELWYVRVLPPPAPELDEHVVFTTPYKLMAPNEREWLSYFQRTLPGALSEDRITAYEQHMKFGPARDYWSEFVFEAYVNHRSNVIFLKGLPDVPESRPHSRVNS